MEWVSKNETKPKKKIMHDCMENIRPQIKDNGITFEYFLVGSSKRNLVLRHHNKGFDCDYQIYIRKNKKNLSLDDCIDTFKDNLIDYLAKEQYIYESSTSSLTFKNVDKDNSEIIHSFDIVFIQENDSGAEIARHHGDDGWRYEQLSDTVDYQSKLKEIKEKGKWTQVRSEYKREKENNEEIEKENRRKSFQIFISSLNEVYKNI